MYVIQVEMQSDMLLYDLTAVIQVQRTSFPDFPTKRSIFVSISLSVPRTQLEFLNGKPIVLGLFCPSF